MGAQVIVTHNAASAQTAQDILNIEAVAALDLVWSNLADCRIILWPANTPLSKAAMSTNVAAAWAGGAASVKLIQPGPLAAPGFDATHAAKENWSREDVLDWLRDHVLVTDQPADEPEPLPDQDTEEPVDASDTTHWSDPVDIFRKLGGQDLQREHLPPILANFVFDQAETMGTDPAILAIAALITCAGLIDDGFEVQPKRRDPTWTESARLWGAVVGDPSVKKSPAIGAAIRHVRKIDMNLGKANAAAMAAYDEDAKAYDKLKPADRSGERPKKPIQARTIVEDITVEALSNVLVDNPKGVLCVQDELSGWFGSMDAYKNGGGGKDRANWLEMYNGGPRRIDRVMRGNFLVPNWSACMLGGIQPDAIKRLASIGTEDGLLQRFMVVIGRPAREGVDRLPDMDALNAYRGLLDQLHALKASGLSATLDEPAALIREAVARKSFLMSGYEALPAGLRSHFGKWEGLFPRLLLTFHIIEAAAAGVFPAAIISGTTAARVQGFMEDFLQPHAIAFYLDVLDSGQQHDHVRWVAGYILAHHKDTLHLRDLTRATRWWSTMSDWQRQGVMRALTEWGWVEPISGSKGPLERVPTRYSVNPKVHSTFVERAKYEKYHREAARGAIAEKIRSRARVPNVDNLEENE